MMQTQTLLKKSVEICFLEQVKNRDAKLSIKLKFNESWKFSEKIAKTKLFLSVSTFFADSLGYKYANLKKIFKQFFVWPKSNYH